MTPTVDDLMSTRILKTHTFTQNSTHYVCQNVYAPGQWYKMKNRWAQLRSECRLTYSCYATVSQCTAEYFNTFILYITHVTEDLNTGTTADSKVGMTVRRNVNRPHKHMTIMCSFSKQKYTLWSFVNSVNKYDKLSRLKLCINDTQKQRRPIILHTILGILINNAVNCYSCTASVKNEWINKQINK